MTYRVVTVAFGMVLISADSIAEARADARRRFGPAGVVSVRRLTTPRICHGCDSQPCCCKDAE